MFSSGIPHFLVSLKQNSRPNPNFRCDTYLRDRSVYYIKEGTGDGREGNYGSLGNTGIIVPSGPSRIKYTHSIYILIYRGGRHHKLALYLMVKIGWTLLLFFVWECFQSLICFTKIVGVRLYFLIGFYFSLYKNTFILGLYLILNSSWNLNDDLVMR